MCNHNQIFGSKSENSISDTISGTGTTSADACKTGIIFDMDGTLWDSSEQVAESWTEVIRQYPNPDRSGVSDADVRSVMGLTMTDIMLQMFPNTDPATRTAMMDRCMSYENEYLAAHGGRLYDGLEAVLQQLNADGWPLYIVSNCQSGYIEAFLDYYHFRKYFRDFSCFGETGQSKDKTMQIVASRNGLSDFWYVGDIQPDYEATMRAGGRFIHAAYGFGKIDIEVPELHRISDLPEMMRSLIDLRPCHRYDR